MGVCWQAVCVFGLVAAAVILYCVNVDINLYAYPPVRLWCASIVAPKLPANSL
jgi:hypothetical protein